MKNTNANPNYAFGILVTIQKKIHSVGLTACVTRDASTGMHVFIYNNAAANGSGTIVLLPYIYPTS